jgi:hypothetical protein
LDGHRSLADLGFSADSLRNRSHELVRSEAMHEIASLYLRRSPAGADRHAEGMRLTVMGLLF